MELGGVQLSETDTVIHGQFRAAVNTTATPISVLSPLTPNVATCVQL